ncbi:hypothetical protein MF271_20470 (plasmid) [Deinococcus sp. KNUC1210]|uniref:MinD/ParA family ATP-binding protein n=1 Tax=Deinococcus sp. KNUC1210 TaxID=2917691 RepID=UPI001EF15FA9|nr:hypothetical protein [Deinococcus sp. KNUC1210]ULH17779.1 hypothetical protein MF271_20470 [Deinococcus sp. KNUC1210]
MSAYVVTLHSFMRGTGKSTLTARLGRLLSRDARVAVIDGDLTAPSQAQLLNVSPLEGHTLNDFLAGRCSAADTALEVPTEPWGGSPDPALSSATGCLYLVPASDQPHHLSQVARSEMPFDELAQGLQDLSAALRLDLILLEAAAGLSGLSLPPLALADELALVMRLDQKDYQGTGVTLDVARRLGVQQARLIVNMVPGGYDLRQVEAKVASTYDAPVTALSLPEPALAFDVPELSQVGRALLTSSHHQGRGGPPR